MDESDTYLHEQFLSSPSGSVTDTSYYETSEDEGTGPAWFGLKTIVTSIGQNIDGLASTINRGARTIINELTELENEALGGRSYSTEGSENSSPVSSIETTILPLPWEICLQSTDADMSVSIVQKEDQPLKDRILSLSSEDSVFVQPFTESTKNIESLRLDDARVMLIRRLLEIDENLGRVHAKVSACSKSQHHQGRSEVKETLFWKNYFYHCERLREERQKEINEENIRRATHDDELDAELVGRPPASCTGFYPRTGKLQEDLSPVDSRVVPAIEKNESLDGFVMVDDETF